MSPPHLLRVDRPVVEFEGLIAALRRDGRRVGWLELPRETPGPVPEGLAAAASHGVLRAVAVAAGRSVAVKPMRGAPVLGDVLREHFRGCQLVLVAGEVDAPLLQPSGETWSLTAAGSPAVRWTTRRLVAALGRPRPWPSEKRSDP